MRRGGSNNIGKKPIIERNRFVILTNGKTTEQIYFGGLLKQYSSMYKVDIEFCNGGIKYLYERAEDISNEPDVNQVWCVFDIDTGEKPDTFRSIILQARENKKINLAYSNPSFECYLLYHLRDNVPPYNTADELIKLLDEDLKKIKKTLKYSKNDDALIINKFLPHYQDAARRSKLCYDTKIKELPRGTDIKPIWEWLGTSNVFGLIEALGLTEKEEKHK